MPEDFFSTMMAATKQPLGSDAFAARATPGQATPMALAGKPFFHASMPLPQPVARTATTNVAALNPAHPGFAATQPAPAQPQQQQAAPTAERPWWWDLNYGSSAL